MAELPTTAFDARAIALMREALELFDSAGGSDAAAMLQHAIDIAEGQAPMTAQDVLDGGRVNHILGPLDLAPRGYHLRPRAAPDRVLQDAGGPDGSDWARH